MRRGFERESTACVSIGNPAAWPVADTGEDSGVELQRLLQERGEGGRSESRWIAAQADWQQKTFLPTLPAASVRRFLATKSGRQLNFYWLRVRWPDRGRERWLWMRPSAPQRAGFPRGSRDKAGVARNSCWQLPQPECVVITASAESQQSGLGEITELRSVSWTVCWLGQERKRRNNL